MTSPAAASVLAKVCLNAGYASPVGSWVISETPAAGSTVAEHSTVSLTTWWTISNRCAGGHPAGPTDRRTGLPRPAFECNEFVDCIHDREFVLVSGAPGSAKTALAARLAGSLQMNLIGKDFINGAGSSPAGGALYRRRGREGAPHPGGSQTAARAGRHRPDPAHRSRHTGRRHRAESAGRYLKPRAGQGEERRAENLERGRKRSAAGAGTVRTLGTVSGGSSRPLIPTKTAPRAPSLGTCLAD